MTIVVSQPSSSSLLRSRTTTVDEQVTWAFRTLLSGAFPKGMALVAAGGYGRRELFPYSDVDLLLLVDKEVHSDQQREALSAFLRTLWDGSLRVSQSVRTVAECTKFDESNVELSISLLDSRFLIGDSDLFEQLKERLNALFRSHKAALMQRVCGFLHARYLKFQDTIYHLEPNLKEGPGGLRDLQTAHWLARLQNTAEEDDEELREARDFLWSVRSRLHQLAGRDQNVLSFDLQERVSEGSPSEWMREFYQNARVVSRHALRAVEQCEQLAASSLIRNFQNWRSRLSNAEFTVLHERVMLKAPQVLSGDPFAAFRMFEFVARHGIRLSLDTERRVRQAVARGELGFLDKRAMWTPFRGMLGLPHADLALRSMHETGVLQLLLPEWNSIESLVVRDFYHRYTVDEHTLVAIGHIEALRKNSEPTRRRFAEMLAETSDPAPLLLALLFHDTGKSDGLADHAITSAVQAEETLKGFGASDEDRSLVRFLVEHHLDLSSVMNSRDLSDPSTAAYLASSVETHEKLRQLTLLTYADISAVNPEAMTPWRLEQLWHTYLAGHRELTCDLDTERIHLESASEKNQLLEGFPTRYLRTHTPQQIEAHLQLARKCRETGVALDVERRTGVWQLTVVTQDRPGLLAGLAGTLSAFGMNIVRAEAFGNTEGTVLDSLVFEDPIRTLELNPSELDRLRTVVKNVVLGKQDVTRLLKGRPQPALVTGTAQILPAVSFDNEASETATLVEIVAQDRPGLLYELASAFTGAGCSIDVVLIDTEAHKAIDVFYVTWRGTKLHGELQDKLQLTLLGVCVA